MRNGFLWMCVAALAWAAPPVALASEPPTAAPSLSTPAGAPSARPHLADYNDELRGPDGRVDIDALLARLRELGVTTYYWLIWHAPTDWDDLQRFLPKAAEADLDVWVYLVPPTESPPRYGTRYSEPFRLDYPRWAEEIARLSLKHPNLTGWVIDDFYANRDLFTPAYLRDLRSRSRAINPDLVFYPLMYFRELRSGFVTDYREVIDGVVVAYLNDREEIDTAWALLNDATVVRAGELMYPPGTPSRPGDFAMARQTARVQPDGRARVQFQERDDFNGPTAGYHFKQLLIDDQVVWEADVADGPPSWRTIDVDVTEQVRGKSQVTLAFRLLDRKGVSNFGVSWRVRDLRAEGLELSPRLDDAQLWQVSRQGAFETGFGSPIQTGQRRFHVPFISMTAANVTEFGQRHGEPATAERVAAQLRLSLQAWRDGKCDGVVTYCLDKRPTSPTFAPVQALFQEFRAPAAPAAP